VASGHRDDPVLQQALACQDLVELVAGYLDKVLSPEQRASMDEHLAGCDGCTDYLEQIRLTVQALWHSHTTFAH
jgi:predicted anti-sigma-YlaC factor YlaD